mmetsp:Transcript_19054/g.52211  ORF Transcript_19054/g.52211 Transcript_19054/m.52211 type:complete len:147 (+) Transcript_19054:879-1319(+)
MKELPARNFLADIYSFWVVYHAHAQKSMQKNFTVRLKPTRVVQMKGPLHDSSSASILFQDCAKPVHWIEEGLVVWNGGNGKGIDIFYMLEPDHNPGNNVLIADRRKRVRGHLDVPEAINNARAVLQNEVEHVDRGSFQHVPVARPG